MKIFRTVILVCVALIVVSCGLTQAGLHSGLGNHGGAYTYTEFDSSYPEIYEQALEGMEAGEFEEAEAGYLELIEKEPHNPNGFIGLAASLIAQQRYLEAAGAYESALEINPNSVEVHIGLGSVYTLMDNFDEAINYYSQAVELEPRNPNAHWGYALVQRSMGEDEVALVHLRLVIEYAAGTRLAKDAEDQIFEILGSRPAQ